MLVVLVSNALKTAAVSGFIFFIFRFLVTRHLLHISDHLRSFSLSHSAPKLELNRRPSEDELDRVVTTINEMGDGLRRAQQKLLRKQRLAALGQFVGSIAHELRNPLGTIATSLEVLKCRVNPEERALARTLARTERSVDRCDRIIGELLDFARRKETEMQPTILDDWLEALLGEYPVPAGITLHRDLRAGDTLVEFDANLLHRAVINLIDNAWQAMMATAPGDGSVDIGEVTVRTIRENDAVRIEVIDNGPGIAPDVRPEIFEALFSTKAFGVGFGLPIVQQIANQHNGTVDIVNEPDHGARAVLSLPLRQPFLRTTLDSVVTGH